MIAETHFRKKIITPASLGILTAGILAALAIMLAIGVSPVQADRVTGRAVIGTITSVDGNTITVSTSQGDFTLKLEEGTRISAPRNRHANIDDLAAHQGSRVAILADQKLANEDGTPAVQATAVRISIIPSKATREHRRVVVTEKRSEGDGTAVDAEGISTELQGVEGSDADGAQLGLPETGESAVLLVRPGANRDQKDEITAVVKTQSVVERLNRLAERLKTQNEDVFQSARIENLLDKHRDAVKKRLDKALAKVEERFKKVIGRAAERAAKALQTTRRTQGSVSGLDEEKSECVRRILGSVPGSKADIPRGQLQRIEVQCLRSDRETAQVRLILPRPGTTLVEGQDVEIRFQVGRLADVVLEVIVNGEVQPFEVTQSQTHSITVALPSGEPILSVEIRQKDSSGDGVTFLEMLYDVRQDPAPRLRITGAVHGGEAAAGSIITLGAQAEDNGEVVSILLTVNGLALGTGTSSFTGLEYPVPAGVTSLLIEATATDDLGNTTTVTRTITVTGVGDAGPKVEITSPAVGAVLHAGTDFNIEVKANDNDRVVSVSGNLTTGSGTSRLVFSPTSLTDTDWRAVATAPQGATSVKVEVTATDSAGNTATADRGWTVQVVADAPPSVKIVSPKDGSSAAEGSSLRVEIEATDDGRITRVEIDWPVSDRSEAATLSGSLWVAQTTVPTLSSATVPKPNSGVPPHVFVGPVTISGLNAPNGTVITAWIDGSSSSRITLEAMATDDSGNTSTTSISLELLSEQVPVGEATVADGFYTLLVSALQGQNITGKTIHFRVAGVAVSQTGSWAQGDGTELRLSR